MKEKQIANIIKLIVLDVDGTLTDGGIYYDADGSESKKFCTKDAAGILVCQAIGICCMILTGRKSVTVERRAVDLHIKYVIQEIEDKAVYLQNFMAENNFKKTDVLYIGDDLNDISAMRLCGTIGCPADAADEILDMADFISRYEGGHGAVRDILFTWLKKEGLYKRAITAVYGIGADGENPDAGSEKL